MKRAAAILGASILVLAVLATDLPATQIIYRSPKELGDESSLVVLGKVRDSRSYWNESGTKILTETLIEVSESYKGQGGALVPVIQLGGVVGNVRMNVHGALSWKRGEEVLLFLEPFRAGTYQVAGFSQGKFEIERDPVTGRPHVKHARLEGVEVLRAPSGETGAAAPPDETMPLRTFVNRALGLQE
jgi:hypothetical protein